MTASKIETKSEGSPATVSVWSLNDRYGKRITNLHVEAEHAFVEVQLKRSELIELCEALLTRARRIDLADYRAAR